MKFPKITLLIFACAAVCLSPVQTIAESSESAALIPMLTATPAAPSPTSIPVQPYPWKIRSVSSMNMSKDRVCNQLPTETILQWVRHARDLGVTHIGLETPYDNPTCNGLAGNYSVDYTDRWLMAIRLVGLNVWHRHMFLQYENIYGAGKVKGPDWPRMIGQYISTNPSFFKPGDVFTPLAEPSNAGVAGATGCDQFCMFSGKTEFNQVIRASITESQSAFKKMGIKNIIMAGVNVDGFALNGLHNPDHEGKFSLLEPATLKIAGIVALDHYPPPGSSMETDLKKIRKRFPDLQLAIGEWGPIFGGDTPEVIKNTFDAFKTDKKLVGVQYWQMGPAGYEGLLNVMSVPNANFSAVQTGFSYNRDL